MFARIAVCSWPTSRINGATHSMAGLCVVRVTSNAYRTRNRGHHNRCRLVINLWAKLDRCLSFCRSFPNCAHNNHPIMKSVKINQIKYTPYNRIEHLRLRARNLIKVRTSQTLRMMHSCRQEFTFYKRFSI